MRFTPLVFKGYGVVVLMVNNQKPGTTGRFSACFKGEEKDGGRRATRAFVLAKCDDPLKRAIGHQKYV
jgi:hypothetical protein